MAVYDFMTQMSRIYEKPLRREHIRTKSPTSMILFALAERWSGATRDGYYQSFDVESPRVQHYDAFDSAHEAAVQRNLRTSNTKWCQMMSRIGINGIELRNNHGVTMRDLIGMDLNTNFAAREFVASLVKLRVTGLYDALTMQLEADLWGWPLPPGEQGTENYRQGLRPEPLSKLFNEEESYNNRSPDFLGEWQPNHAWSGGRAPGDGVSAATRKLINIPRVFGPTGNNPSKRNLTKRLVTQPLTQMMDVSGGGRWIFPTHPLLFEGLASEFDEHFRPPLLIGGNKLKIGVTCIEYMNGLFYPEHRAPADELWGIFIGNTMGRSPRDRPQGFQIVQWSPPNMTDLARTAYGGPLQIKQHDDVKQIGWNMEVPYYDTMWTRDYPKAAALIGEAHTSYLFVTKCRFMNIKLTHLQPRPIA